MCRNGTVVNNPAAHRGLRFHHAKRRLGTKEGTGQVYIDDSLPFLEGTFFKCSWRRTTASIVEQNIQSLKLIADRLKQVRD